MKRAGLLAIASLALLAGAPAPAAAQVFQEPETVDGGYTYSHTVCQVENTYVICYHWYSNPFGDWFYKRVNTGMQHV